MNDNHEEVKQDHDVAETPDLLQDIRNEKNDGTITEVYLEPRPKAENVPIAKSQPIASDSFGKSLDYLRTFDATLSNLTKPLDYLGTFSATIANLTKPTDYLGSLSATIASLTKPPDYLGTLSSTIASLTKPPEYSALLGTTIGNLIKPHDYSATLSANVGNLINPLGYSSTLIAGIGKSISAPDYTPFSGAIVSSHTNNLFGKGVEHMEGIYNVRSDGMNRESTVATLNNQIRELQQKLETQLQELRVNEKQLRSSEQRNEEHTRLIETMKALQEQQDLNFLLNRIATKSHAAVLTDINLKNRFLADGESSNAYVVSVDIRRSTDLMLKAKSPQMFASFITKLSEEFRRIITDCYGVFDKFTGDGILAFFPEFYSGLDAGARVVHAASLCHEYFKKLYKASRGFFTSVSMDVGLGIGVDYGPVTILKIADGITVVGVPVVYACRLGGAPANFTYLNHTAYESICSRHASAYLINETTLEIKHEGKMLAYSVTLSGECPPLEIPEWEKISAVPKTGATSIVQE